MYSLPMIFGTSMSELPGYSIVEMSSAVCAILGPARYTMAAASSHIT